MMLITARLMEKEMEESSAYVNIMPTSELDFKAEKKYSRKLTSEPSNWIVLVNTIIPLIYFNVYLINIFKKEKFVRTTFQKVDKIGLRKTQTHQK